MPTSLAEGGRYTDLPPWTVLPLFISERISEGPFQELHSALLDESNRCALVCLTRHTHFSPVALFYLEHPLCLKYTECLKHVISWQPLDFYLHQQ